MLLLTVILIDMPIVLALCKVLRYETIVAHSSVSAHISLCAVHYETYIGISQYLTLCSALWDVYRYQPISHSYNIRCILSTYNLRKMVVEGCCLYIIIYKRVLEIWNTFMHHYIQQQSFNSLSVKLCISYCNTGFYNKSHSIF